MADKEIKIEMLDIANYHAHVYFSESEQALARELRQSVADTFGDRVKIGSWHDDPVGPHPRGSYQITVSVEDMGEFLPWMAVNRSSLTVFVHLNSGQHYADHTQHVIWLGESEKLDTGIFEK